MLQPGDVLEQKYRIVRPIGEGGMGAVYEAEALRLRRRVAIKVLHAGSPNEQELAARFLLEAQASGRIGSRHVVDVLDVGQLPSGAHFMVMEYLEGSSLRERIEATAPMAPAAIYPWLLQLLQSLIAVHAAGVIHRDLKPENIFLTRQPDGTDFVKLLDFGISKFQSAPSGSADALGLTSTGTFLGTPYYLSPEQASGAGLVDRRSDLYAVGVVLYECIAGALPHSASSFNQLLFAIVLEPPRPLLERVPHLDPGLAAFVERAMHKQPDARFQSAEEMKHAFESWAHGAPESRIAGHGTASAADPPAVKARQWPAASQVTVHDSPSSEVGLDQTHGSWWNSRASAEAGAFARGALRGRVWPIVVAGGLLVCLVVVLIWARSSGQNETAARAGQPVASAGLPSAPTPAPIPAVVPANGSHEEASPASLPALPEPPPDTIEKADDSQVAAPRALVPTAVHESSPAGSTARKPRAISVPHLSPETNPELSRTGSGRVIRDDL